MAQDGFYNSLEWQEVRAQVFTRDKPVCRACFDEGSPENPLHVDHIRPRSKYPELSLDLDNLQILCSICNTRKGDRDYRGILDRISYLRTHLETYEHLILNLQNVHDTQCVNVRPVEEWVGLGFTRLEEPKLFDEAVAVLERRKVIIEQNLRDRFGLEPTDWERKRTRDIKEVVSDYPA